MSVQPVARSSWAARPARRWSDGTSRVRTALVVVTAYATAALVTTGAAVLALPGARAAAEPDVALRASGAPLGDVLAHLAAVAGGRARVADDIADRVSGSLVGDATSLVALLVDAHGLELHRDGETLWFDREGRTVVDFVPLSRSMIVTALETLAAPVAPGGTVQVEASGRGLVLSGTRGYVRTSLARIAMATGAEVEPAARADADARAPLPGLEQAVDVADEDALAERVVLVSARPPRYVQLEDGTRLVVGSTLADGRRLTAIERERLVFDDGEAETALALP